MQRPKHEIAATAKSQRRDRRTAGRQKLVLRIGLLQQEGRSIVCLVKNVSSAGIQIQPYGQIVQGTGITLQVGDEDTVAGTVVWSRDGKAGIEFAEPIGP